MVTVVTPTRGATLTTVITGSIAVWGRVITRISVTNGVMSEVDGSTVEATPQGMSQRMLNRDHVYKTIHAENMVHTQELTGAMLMLTKIGTTAAVQNQSVTSMVKATNGVTLQTVNTIGITVLDRLQNTMLVAYSIKQHSSLKKIGVNI